MTVQEMIEKIPELSLTDRQQLMHALVDSLADESKQYDILEFAGVGKALYDGTDAQDYIIKLRDK